MARKKHLQDVDPEDMAYIDEKMKASKDDALSNGLPFVSYDFKVQAKCKNQKQKEFLNLLKDEEKEICVGIGAAGSGKSYISLAYALMCIRHDASKFRRIICLVPTCPAGNMNIGFLKGTLEEKIEPYLEADTHTMEKILENSGNKCPKPLIEGLIRNDVIRYELVNFARGKTFDKSLILINEAENYSKEEMLLILTRVGEGSKIIITGDLEQCDRQDIKKPKLMCGLEYACERLGNMKEFGKVEFTEDDIVRNKLISKIIKAWK